MFFKSRVRPDEFAKCLLREHQAIFGLNCLVQICKQYEFHFRDEPTFIEAFYEWQAFGLYSIAFGVRTQCGQEARATILGHVNELFAAISGPNWKMMLQRVSEYEEFSNSAPVGDLAVKNIFDQPPGILQSRSMEAFGLRHTMNASLLDAVKTVEGLFKQYKVAHRA